MKAKKLISITIAGKGELRNLVIQISDFLNEYREFEPTLIAPTSVVGNLNATIIGYIPEELFEDIKRLEKSWKITYNSYGDEIDNEIVVVSRIKCDKAPSDTDKNVTVYIKSSEPITLELIVNITNKYPGLTLDFDNIKEIEPEDKDHIGIKINECILKGSIQRSSLDSFTRDINTPEVFGYPGVSISAVYNRSRKG